MDAQMKIETKIEGANATHATVRVIVDGVSCGLLTATKPALAELIVRVTTDPKELVRKVCEDFRASLDEVFK